VNLGFATQICHTTLNLIHSQWLDKLTTPFDLSTGPNLIMVGGTTTPRGSSSPTRPSDPIETHEKDPVFNHEQCIFCNKFFGTFDSNVAHMQTSHGLFIPDKEHLIVDLETLFSYLHLVIVGHHECICCGTQRNTPVAVQQRQSALALILCRSQASYILLMLTLARHAGQKPL
jgi:hypothetical protein